MKRAEEYLVDRLIILGCVDQAAVHDELVKLQEIDNPFKTGALGQRFSKDELLEVR